MSGVAASTREPVLLRRGLWLEYLTIGWNFVISSLYSSAVLAGRAFAAATGCSWLR